MTDAAIFADIDRRRQDLIGLTLDLIRIPTLNPPGRNYRAICDYLGERLLAQGFTVEFIRALFEGQPTMAPQDAPIVTATASAIDRIGRLKNCIACGPGLLHLAHHPNEWVGVQDMIDSAKVMALVLGDLLGSPAGTDQPPAA